MKQLKIDNGHGIFALWLNWVMGSAAIVGMVILSLWIRPLYLPFVAWGIQLLLFIAIRYNRKRRIPECYLLPFIVSRVMFWTGVVMAIINMLYSDILVSHVFAEESINRDIPFITILIMAPVTMLIAGWGYFNQHSISFCRDCKMRNGTPAERGFLGRLFTNEAQYQVRMLLVLSAVCVVVGWAYYALLYVNESLSLPDRFVFFILPILLWLAAAIYLGIRYIGIWGYYCQNVAPQHRFGANTLLRYLIICENKIALLRPEMDVDRTLSLDDKLDTPISVFVKKCNDITPYVANEYFTNFSGLKNADIRPMYTYNSGNADGNIFHYLVFISPEQKKEIDNRFPNIEWVTLPELVELINSKQVMPLFAAEFIRLHTVAMAWKTYTPTGKRRYKIKHYKPTFHINDIAKWDVDYNDANWLYVADNNQDTPFYHMRKFWRKYINGVGK